MINVSHLLLMLLCLGNTQTATPQFFFLNLFEVYYSRCVFTYSWFSVPGNILIISFCYFYCRLGYGVWSTRESLSHRAQSVYCAAYFSFSSHFQFLKIREQAHVFGDDLSATLKKESNPFDMSNPDSPRMQQQSVHGYVSLPGRVYRILCWGWFELYGYFSREPTVYISSCSSVRQGKSRVPAKKNPPKERRGLPSWGQVTDTCGIVYTA